jgi:plasmid stabilization system protein ParE
MNSKRYQVFWTQTAQQDLSKIIEYIAAGNKLHAGRIYAEIKEKAGNLQQSLIKEELSPELKIFQHIDIQGINHHALEAYLQD